MVETHRDEIDAGRAVMVTWTSDERDERVEGVERTRSGFRVGRAHGGDAMPDRSVAR
jgi:hypothetical protein